VKPDYYREQAKRCRAMAKRTLDDDARLTLLTVAIEYDALAAEAEKRLNSDE